MSICVSKQRVTIDLEHVQNLATIRIGVHNEFRISDAIPLVFLLENIACCVTDHALESQD